jgi:Periplasmic binding protein
MFKHRIGVGLALIVLAVGVVACDGSAQTSQSPSSSAGSPTTGHGSAGNAIEIYDIGPNPDAALDPTAGQVGVEAAVREINNSGDVGSFSAEGQAAEAVQLLNSKRLCYAYVDVPSVGGQAALINQWILAPRHLSLYKSIPLSLTAADLSPQAAQASGCDAIAINSSTQQSILYIQAIRALGNNVPIICDPAVGPSVLAQALGSSPTNIYQAGRFYRNSPGFAQYEKDMSALHYANTQYDNDNSVMAWAALKEFAAIAKSLPSVTRQAVLAAYKKQSKVTSMGLSPALNLTVPQSGAGGAYPAVRNDTTVLYKYDAGTFHFIGNTQRPFIQVMPGGNTPVAFNAASFAGTP